MPTIPKHLPISFLAGALAFGAVACNRDAPPGADPTSEPEPGSPSEQASGEGTLAEQAKEARQEVLAARDALNARVQELEEELDTLRSEAVAAGDAKARKTIQNVADEVELRLSKTKQKIDELSATSEEAAEDVRATLAEQLDALQEKLEAAEDLEQ